MITDNLCFFFYSLSAICEKVFDFLFCLLLMDIKRANRAMVVIGICSYFSQENHNMTFLYSLSENIQGLFLARRVFSLSLSAIQCTSRINDNYILKARRRKRETERKRKKEEENTRALFLIEQQHHSSFLIFFFLNRLYAIATTTSGERFSSPPIFTVDQQYNRTYPIVS